MVAYSIDSVWVIDICVYALLLYLTKQGGSTFSVWGHFLLRVNGVQRLQLPDSFKMIFKLIYGVISFLHRSCKSLITFLKRFITH